eukprot:scaffold38425_cov48-Phaeocystis_antarctica.AAC.2
MSRAAFHCPYSALRSLMDFLGPCGVRRSRAARSILRSARSRSGSQSRSSLSPESDIPSRNGPTQAQSTRNASARQISTAPESGPCEPGVHPGSPTTGIAPWCGDTPGRAQPPLKYPPSRSLHLLPSYNSVISRHSYVQFYLRGERRGDLPTQTRSTPWLGVCHQLVWRCGASRSA